MPFLYGLIVAVLGAILSRIAVPLVRKILVGLGIGFFVFQGMDMMLSQAFASVRGQIGLLPTDILNVLAYLDIDKMISLVFSALGVQVTFKVSKMALSKK